MTEVRAEVVSFNLTSNYNNECLKCHTFPANWASIQSGSLTPTPSFAPKICLFNGATTSSFNATGSGLYQNPREVAWNNNGASFTAPTGMQLSFLLPPPPVIDCCELRGEICVKFTFRDTNCRECEVTKCLSYTIDKDNHIIFALQ